MMPGRTQKESVMASQNLCTPPDNLNQNPQESVSTVRVGIEDMIKISLDDEDYAEPDTDCHGRIAAASASPTSSPELLSGVRSILKWKAQAEEGLATPKTAGYGTWERARAYLEGDVIMPDVPEMVQKSRRKKEVHFDTIANKPQPTIIIERITTKGYPISKQQRNRAESPTHLSNFSHYLSQHPDYFTDGFNHS